MKFIINKNEKLHEDFIQETQNGNLLNTSNWGKLKSESWENDIVSVLDKKGKIVASSLVLTKKVFKNRTILYLPRGPILDYHNKELVKFFFENLKKYAKGKKAIFVKFDPIFLEKTIDNDRKVFRDENVNKYINNLKKIGVIYCGKTQEMTETIQPRFNAIIDLEEFKEEYLPKKMKQYLRKSRKSFLDFEVGRENLLDDFSNLIKETEKRKNIKLRDKKYFSKILNLYPETSYIVVAYINMEKVIESIDREIITQKNKKDKAKSDKKLIEIEENIKNLERKQNKFVALRSEFGNRQAVSATLCVSFNKQTECLYACMNDKFSSFYPSHFVWYQSILYSFENGNVRFNTGGVENSLSDKDGLLKFKKLFSPTIEEYSGEFNLPISRFSYPIANYFYNKKKVKK